MSVLGDNFNAADIADMFRFLDDLRVSGKVNMYGARPFVASEFSLDKEMSAEVLSSWMATFSDAPAIDRAWTALEEEGQS